MARRTNPKIPIPRDMVIFERAMIRGERQTALAREFGLSKQRVNKICGRVGKMVFHELAEDFSDHRRLTVLRLEHVYSEALAAWEHSKAGRSADTETTNAQGEVTRSTTHHVADGDVRYLTEARQALADLRALCGIDATKTEVLEVRESKTLRVELANVSDEQIEADAALYDLLTSGAFRIVDDSATGGEGVRDVGEKRLLLGHTSPKLL